MNNDPFAPVSKTRPKSISARRPVATAVVAPVPSDAPPAPTRHPLLGKPSARWTYTDSRGELLGHVLRFDSAKGKEFRPLTLWRDASHQLGWRWMSWPFDRPLYGLHRLAERPNAPVVLCEGEKSADAASRLLPGSVAVTSSVGARSARNTDWGRLKGRAVTVWPDADPAGAAYAKDVAQLAYAAGASSVEIVPTNSVAKVGWDAADALAEGWTTEQALALINTAILFDRTPSNASAKPFCSTKVEKVEEEIVGHRRTPQRDILIGLCDDIELWHDTSHTAYVTFRVNGHCEHWPVNSRHFVMYLSKVFYQKTGASVSSQTLQDSLRTFEATAVHDGLEHEVFLRVGSSDGAIFLDLCDKHWRIVKITAEGWDIVDDPTIKFLRSPGMQPLPVPVRGHSVEELKNFLNVTGDDFKLTVAFLVAAYRPRGPYPILVLNGEPGTGKSWFTTLIKNLIDPSKAPIRSLPRDNRDLFVSASNSYCLAFDNISGMPAWLADDLCRLASGSGFATRALHTDRDEIIFEAARPIILNGIPILTDRSDLADRALLIQLSAISEKGRRDQADMLTEFIEARPRIVGALLTAVSSALANESNTRMERAPRLADFAKWITAAEPGLDWKSGEFAAAYSVNRREGMESSFEADAVAVAIWDLVTHKMSDGFFGSATQLLAELNALATEGVKRARGWPIDPSKMGSRLSRAAPVLKANGCVVERKKSGSRFITILPPTGSDVVDFNAM
jgi:putative DNA primase/helicase